jgi:hypothetical protein
MDDDTLTPDNTRRDFLRKTAIGAAVAGGAWVAPTVLSLDAAHAAGTCPNGSLSLVWSAIGEGTRFQTANTTAATSLFVRNVGGPTGVDIRAWSTTSTGVAAAGLVGDNWMTRGPAASAACPPTVNCGTAATTNFPRGNSTSFYSLLMNAQINTGGTGLCTTCNAAGTAARTTEVTFGFFTVGTTTLHAVRNLAFNLYDIDASNNNYRDQVQVFINASATEATVGPGLNCTATLPGGGASTVTTPLAATAIFRAIAGQSAAANSVNGNVNLQFLASLSITQVRVRFQDILGAAPATVQWVGIGDMSFCKT